MREKRTVMKDYGSEAQPGAVLVESRERTPGSLSIVDNSPAAAGDIGAFEKSAVSCQYKDNSFTSSENCTPVGTYADEKHGAKPVDNSPVSVKACHNKAWTLKLWKKSNPADQINVPFTCRTWRHEGPCQRFKGAQDFVRMKEGLFKHEGWVYMVLTYEDRRGSVANAYRKIGRQFQHFRQWIQRNYAAAGETLQYIALIEQHRDGYPHVNVLVHCRRFVDEALKDWQKLRKRVRRHAMATGFGKVFYLAPMKNQEAMAAYFVKLCGEVSKMSQAPMKAPSKFQRFRSSNGLLPPIRKDPEYTGELVQVPADIAKRMPAHRPMLKAEIARINKLETSKFMLNFRDSIAPNIDGYGDQYNMAPVFRLKLFA